MWPFSSGSSSSSSSSKAAVPTNESSSSSVPSGTSLALPNDASSPSPRISSLPIHSVPALSPLPPPVFHPETLRIPLTAMGIGFISGCFTSASRASTVFMAENAHRQPDTVQGWYFYNKTKNYKIILAGGKGGAKTALRLGAWAGSWVALDHATSLCRRKLLYGPSPSSAFATIQPSTVFGSRPDAVSSASYSVPAEMGTEIAAASAMAYHPQDRYMRWFDGAFAGMGVASGAVLLHRLSRPTSTRFILGGVLAGGLAGGLRDLQGLLSEAQAEPS
ncbi:unnamed protein product [Tilletia controversa]|uniref:Uncharacterized protein n=1 Tax=Tilletia controversa TaxID=13291 RepID=A0A8X7MUD9_9BASI|nr:hypothetical protein CF328_g1130 [Tilletia controversa]KAE8249397.1 hypothetical protein A4X06_0g3252 [Tilletia controversa]CAD6911926.1 unnamed protein product [Tilletia controversa]CAD6916416.1 unnamed protein product [Tilletia controversa]CAD6921915.1 unnamed protein product [Tilletia controversa]